MYVCKEVEAVEEGLHFKTLWYAETKEEALKFAKDNNNCNLISLEQGTPLEVIEDYNTEGDEIDIDLYFFEGSTT